MSATGMLLLHDVCERIMIRHLQRQGRVDVHATGGLTSLGGRSVDITYAWQGGQKRVKLKADPYFGTDGAKTRDRSLVFYREDVQAFAFEAVANAATREPGWIFESSADELYYYYIAIAQTEDEIRALMSEPDAVFFAELAVDRDELVCMPMRETRAWFEANYEAYTPRPALIGGASAWYRLVPRADLERAVAGARSMGPVFKSLGA